MKNRYKTCLGTVISTVGTVLRTENFIRCLQFALLSVCNNSSYIRVSNYNGRRQGPQP